MGEQEYDILLSVNEDQLSLDRIICYIKMLKDIADVLGCNSYVL